MPRRAFDLYRCRPDHSQTPRPHRAHVRERSLQSPPVETPRHKRGEGGRRDMIRDQAPPRQAQQTSTGARHNQRHQLIVLAKEEGQAADEARHKVKLLLARLNRCQTEQNDNSTDLSFPPRCFILPLAPSVRTGGMVYGGSPQSSQQAASRHESRDGTAQA
jgi:hypothetical protein